MSIVRLLFPGFGTGQSNDFGVGDAEALAIERLVIGNSRLSLISDSTSKLNSHAPGDVVK